MCCCLTRFDRQEFANGLPLNDAACDSRPGVACGVGFIVVCLCVNHNRRTTFVKERVRAVAEGNVRIQKRRLTGSAGLYLDVEQVSGVLTFGIVFSVLLRGWVEMRSCAREGRTFALASGMNVNAMRAGWQLRNLNVNANPAIGSADRRGTDILSPGVDNIPPGGLRSGMSEQGGAPNPTGSGDASGGLTPSPPEVTSPAWLPDGRP